MTEILEGPLCLRFRKTQPLVSSSLLHMPTKFSLGTNSWLKLPTHSNIFYPISKYSDFPRVCDQLKYSSFSKCVNLIIHQSVPATKNPSLLVISGNKKRKEKNPIQYFKLRKFKFKIYCFYRSWIWWTTTDDETTIKELLLHSLR